MAGKMHKPILLLALLAIVWFGIIDAADVQCSRKHASLQGAGPIRPADSSKSRKLLTLGDGFSVDVSLPSVQVTVGTGDSAPGVRRGGNSGPDSWQWWGGNNGPSWQQPGFGTPGWNRPPPSWQRPPPSWQRPPPSWNRNPGWTR